jgi:hypothetical protein
MIRVTVISKCEAVWIIENAGGQVEVYAVPGEVAGGLDGVPRKLHL